MLFYNDNPICSSLVDVYLINTNLKWRCHKHQEVVQIVSHDLFKAFSFALQTQFAVTMLHVPETTELRKHKALPLMASLFSCLQGCLARIIFDGRVTNDHREMAPYILVGHL